MGKEKDLQFVRLDTTKWKRTVKSVLRSNAVLPIKEFSQIEWTADLPEHYKEGSFALFEIENGTQ